MLAYPKQDYKNYCITYKNGETSQKYIIIVMTWWLDVIRYLIYVKARGSWTHSYFRHNFGKPDSSAWQLPSSAWADQRSYQRDIVCSYQPVDNYNRYLLPRNLQKLLHANIFWDKWSSTRNKHCGRWINYSPFTCTCYLHLSVLLYLGLV